MCCQAEEDISQILERSQPVKYSSDAATGALTIDTGAKDGAPAAAAATTGGQSTFSKATFIPTEGGEELSLSDPLFWQRIGMQDHSEPVSVEPIVLDTKRVRKPVQAFQPEGGSLDEEESGAAMRRDVLGRQAKSDGPVRCQICLSETRDGDDSSPVLLCDTCGEEAHLNCLGLFSIPAEDHWECPSCVRQAGKKSTRKRSALDEAEDADYQPEWKGPADAAGAVDQRFNPTSAATLGLKRTGPAAAAAKSKAPLAQTPAQVNRSHYDRLLSTYRKTHPTLSDEEHRDMTNKLWRQVFKQEPPAAPAEPVRPAPAAGGIKHAVAAAVAAAAATPPPAPSAGVKCSGPDCSKRDGTPHLPPFLYCGKCHREKYCSQTCQVAHWRAGHRAACKPSTAPAAASTV